MKIAIDVPVLKSLLTVATMIEARDAFTGGHTWRTGHYASFLADKLGLGPDLQFAVRIGGLVHDVGKIGIPDTILNKQARLTDQEYTVMRQHPAIGETIIAYHPLRNLIRSAVVEHHEHPDGNGYPRGLWGQSLSIIGKVVTVADVFDAMTSTRSYHPGRTVDETVAHVERGKGGQFDPAVADALSSVVGDGSLSGVLGHSAEDVRMVSCPGCGPIVVRPKYAESGDEIACPGCAKVFRLHRDGETFVLEWAGRSAGIRAPTPDMETVEDLLRVGRTVLDI